MADPVTQNGDERIQAVVRDFMSLRKRPLLILFYSDLATISADDVRDVYDQFRNRGRSKESKLKELDVLLHTNGGEPISAYRLAQVVRDFTDHLKIVVADHAYSAGTLLSLAGNEIELGDCAGLSPIDIALTWGQFRKRDDVELANVDHFIKFAQRAREETEGTLDKIGRKGSTSNVDSDLLVELCRQVEAMTVGKYFRERTITGYYAEILLDSYMFKGVPDAKRKRISVIRHLLFEAPSHQLHMDYHLCLSRGLVVKQLHTDISVLCKNIVDELDKLTQEGLICNGLSQTAHIPFISYFDYVETPPKNGEVNASGQTIEQRDGEPKPADVAPPDVRTTIAAN